LKTCTRNGGIIFLLNENIFEIIFLIINLHCLRKTYNRTDFDYHISNEMLQEIARAQDINPKMR